MVAASRYMCAICFASAMLEAAAAAADCPTIPSGSVPDAAMLRAMTCVDPSTISGAPESAGRVVLSSLMNISSKGVACDEGEYETKALLAAGAGTMTLGAATCSLTGLGLAKTSDTNVEMRLDFNQCSVGPQTAHVFLNVVKATGSARFMSPSAVSIYPFIKEACTKITTTLKPSSAQVSVSFSETSIGANTCAGTIIKSYPGLDKRACKMTCIAVVERYAAEGTATITNPDLCLGYAVNAASTGVSTCHLYGSGNDVVGITQEKEDGWMCYSLKATEHVIQTSSPAPLTPAQIAEEEAKLPRLNLQIEAESASVLTFASAENQCYTPFNVITLQDGTFNTFATTVHENEWGELMNRLPSTQVVVTDARRLEASVAAPVAHVLADRVAYGYSAALPGAPNTAATASAAAAVAAAAPVASTTVACKPVPPVDGSPVPNILALVLGVASIPFAYFGYRVGHQQHQKGSAYQPLE